MHPATFYTRKKIQCIGKIHIAIYVTRQNLSAGCNFAKLDLIGRNIYLNAQQSNAYALQNYTCTHTHAR